MSDFCSIGGCKNSNVLYGVIDPISNKLHKLSFSRNLIDHIVNTTDGYQSATFTCTLGEHLCNGQSSPSGLYGIVATKKKLLLRVQIDPQTADLLTQDDSRHLQTVWLNRIC